jgi:hypothetical protein
MRRFISGLTAVGPICPVWRNEVWERIWGSHSGGYEEYYLLGKTPCSPLKVNRRFGGIYRLHFHCLKISRARNQREIRWQTELSRWFLARHIFRPWRWRRYVPPKRRLTFNGLHSIMSQKMVLFITTVVSISNPTCDWRGVSQHVIYHFTSF